MKREIKFRGKVDSDNLEFLESIGIKHENGNDFIANVSHRFSKEDLWDAWWASAIKTISFSGVDKEYERRCFEKFYENKISSPNGG